MFVETKFYPANTLLTSILSSQRVAKERESDVRFNLLTVKANVDGGVATANIQSQRALNIFVCGCYEGAIAEGEDIETMNTLGFLFAKGTEGIEQDLGKARQLYKREIAEGQFVPALFNLRYLSGKGRDGVEQD